jgi:hypothetical protein
MELDPDALALLAVGVGIDILGLDAGGFELLVERSGTSAIDGEAQGRAILAALKPCRDDVGDELRLVHRLRQVALVIVAGDCADPGQVRMRWSENAEG